MRKRLALVVMAAAALAAATLPAYAQRPSVRLIPGVNSRPAAPPQVFVPGVGFRPANNTGQFPVFGQGFDAHHHFILNKHSGFIGGGFFGRGRRFFAGGFLPFFSGGATSTVVVVQQPVPVPVVVQNVATAVVEDAEVIVPLGLPLNWSQLRVVKPSFAEEPARLPQLTLLVLKDGAIFAATDYWLEDGRIFYVTSTGREDSLLVRDLDLEMTARLNAERHVAFILRSR